MELLDFPPFLVDRGDLSDVARQIAIWRTVALTCLQRSLEVNAFDDRKCVIWPWLISPSIIVDNPGAVENLLLHIR